MRTFLGALIGILVAFVAMVVFAFIGGSLFPIPARVSIREPDQVRAAFELAPIATRLSIVLAWTLGAFVGAMVAKAISGRRGPVWIVALLMCLYGLANTFFFPMPAWLAVLAVAGPLIAGMIADRVIRTRADVTDEATLSKEEPLDESI